jgi:hypothetical protein
MRPKLVRLKIIVTYLTGETVEFLSYNLPKFEGGNVLINTDYGVVAIAQKDLA